MTDDAVATRMLEVLGDLAAALKLPPDASMSQITGASAALQGRRRQLREKTAELTALKVRLAAEAADKAVGEALMASGRSPRSNGPGPWRFPPEGACFASLPWPRPQRRCLWANSCRCIGEERSPAEALAPEELNIVGT